MAAGGRVAVAARPRTAFARLDRARPLPPDSAAFRLRFATTTQADIVQAIPGVQRVDGYTVAYSARDMTEACQLIRGMYQYISAQRP